MDRLIHSIGEEKVIQSIGEEKMIDDLVKMLGKEKAKRLFMERLGED